MGKFAQLGNDLHSGKKSYNIVGKSKLWFTIALICVALSILVPVLKGGFNLGIEFRGGSEFRVSQVQDAKGSIPTAEQAVSEVAPQSNPKVTTTGDDAVVVQTDQLQEAQSQQLRQVLSQKLNVPPNNVTSSFIGPTWGEDVTQSAIKALIIFLIIVSVVMALYFRTWKMSLAAIISLLHDLILTAGIYAITGLEVTPATVIGFLTILGYSMYDTVVVFDKVRENTKNLDDNMDMTFTERVNLALNQTLVRSINTSVVAVLPVASILFIGAFWLGAGTLKDISLALFIGILVGTYSTIFIATPLYARLRENEPKIKAHDEKVLANRASGHKETSAAIDDSDFETTEI